MGVAESEVGIAPATTDSHRPRVASCPVCLGTKLSARFQINVIPLEACDTCGLVLQNPQPSDRELTAIYGPDYFIGAGDDPALAAQFAVVKRATARLQLDDIVAYLAKQGRSANGLRLLEIGCGHGNMLVEARARGFDVHGLEFSADAAAIANRKLGDAVVRVGSPAEWPFPARAFDVCILADVIEHLRDPRAALMNIERTLDARGMLYLATPSLDSWSARILRKSWVEYKPEHLYYFDVATIRRMLKELGFADIEVSGGKKILTASYIIGHFEKFPVPMISGVLRLVRALAPQRLLEKKMKITASGINVYARKS